MYKRECINNKQKHNLREESENHRLNLKHACFLSNILGLTLVKGRSAALGTNGKDVFLFGKIKAPNR